MWKYFLVLSLIPAFALARDTKEIPKEELQVQIFVTARPHEEGRKEWARAGAIFTDYDHNYYPMSPEEELTITVNDYTWQYSEKKSEQDLIPLIPGATYHMLYKRHDGEMIKAETELPAIVFLSTQESGPFKPSKAVTLQFAPSSANLGDGFIGTAGGCVRRDPDEYPWVNLSLGTFTIPANELDCVWAGTGDALLVVANTKELPGFLRGTFELRMVSNELRLAFIP